MVFFGHNPFGSLFCPLEVPISTSQRLRLGSLEEAGEVPKGTIDTECSGTPSWKKNCSRQAWSMFYRLQLGWKVKLTNFHYTAPNGDQLTIPYISPKDILPYLMKHHPDLVIGGLDSACERSLHLEAFWEAYRIKHPTHEVFAEHEGSLQNTLPIYWHGDEGRGKRRGNTVVISIETPIGIHTLTETKKRPRPCGCAPPNNLKVKFGNQTRQLPSRLKQALSQQRTTMTGHSFLQHWVLIILPTAICKSYPGVTKEMLHVIGKEFRELFYEGFEVNGRTYCVSIIGAKGDLKWFCRVANFDRSFENQGVTTDQPCCHECLAGSPNLAWEDVGPNPCWNASVFSVRPWSIVPPMSVVPYDVSKPEFQYKKDPFHLCKVGIFRDLAGSVICFLCFKGFFGLGGDVSEKLNRAHSAFVMYTMATSQTPALRSFSKAFMMWPKFASYPWVNSKGSDTMLLLRWLSIQLIGFQNDPGHAASRNILEHMRKTIEAALAIFSLLNKHGLHLDRDCGMTLYAHITRFIHGYTSLARINMADQRFNAFGLKPKLHLLRHCSLELEEMLGSGWGTIPISLNAENCEQCEDLIGRVSRLSRRFDSRRVCERVLKACLLKACLLHRRWRLSNRLSV